MPKSDISTKMSKNDSFRHFHRKLTVFDEIIHSRGHVISGVRQFALNPKKVIPAKGIFALKRSVPHFRPKSVGYISILF